MVELLKEKNYDVMNFKPFIDYIAYLESRKYSPLTVEEKYGWIDEKYEGENHILQILTFKDKEKEWVSIYKYKNQREKFEQIEFMTFNEKYFELNDSQDSNRVIYYAAHFEDEQFTRMVCSGYAYQDNELLDGWRELRKFAVEDLEKVMYSKSMNLTELTGIADEKISEFYEVISLKEEVKKLKLGY